MDYSQIDVNNHKSLFKFIDTDNSGSISSKELYSGLAKLGIRTTNLQI